MNKLGQRAGLTVPAAAPSGGNTSHIHPSRAASLGMSVGQQPPVKFHVNLLCYYTNNVITGLTEKAQNLGTAANGMPWSNRRRSTPSGDTRWRKKNRKN